MLYIPYYKYPRLIFSQPIHMAGGDNNALSKLSPLNKAAIINPHRRSPRASERDSTRKRLSASVSSQNSDSEGEDIRSKEDARKRRRLSEEDKKNPARDHSRGTSASDSCRKRARDRPDMLDSWVSPEAAKRLKRVDMEWDSWIAPDLREGEERREQEAMARLRAKRTDKERKKRSRRTRYDTRTMDSWVAPQSPSTPEKYEHREQRRSPDASPRRGSGQSLSPSKQDQTTNA